MALARPVIPPRRVLGEIIGRSTAQPWAGTVLGKGIAAAAATTGFVDPKVRELPGIVLVVLLQL